MCVNIQHFQFWEHESPTWFCLFEVHEVRVAFEYRGKLKSHQLSGLEVHEKRMGCKSHQRLVLTVHEQQVRCFMEVFATLY